MAKPLDPKEIVSTQKLAISKMLAIEALRQLLFEKEIITEEKFIARFKKLDSEIKEKREVINERIEKKGRANRWIPRRKLRVVILLPSTLLSAYCYSQKKNVKEPGKEVVP